MTAVAARDAGEGTEVRVEARHRRRCTPTYDALLADPDVDAIYNPLPNGLHGRWTIAAVQAGKHVLCEKPFTANADEARAVAEVVRPTDRVVMEAFHYRYHPFTDRVVEVLALGRDRRRAPHRDVDVHPPPAPPRHPLAAAAGRRVADGRRLLRPAPAAHLRRCRAGDHLRHARSSSSPASTGGCGPTPASPTAAPGGSPSRCSPPGCSPSGRGSTARRAVSPCATPRPRSSSAGSPSPPEARSGASGPRKEATYLHQLRAFTGAVLRGEPFPTTVDDAIANMTAIDACYRAAGLEPRSPSP